MQKDQKNVRSHGELNPALPIQSQVSLPSNHQLMKIASKNGKIEKNKTEHAVQSYAAGKTTLEVMLRMKILSNKSVIAEYQKC